MACSTRACAWAPALSARGRVAIVACADIQHALLGLQGVAKVARDAELGTLHGAIRRPSSDAIVARTSNVDTLPGVFVVAVFARIAHGGAIGVARST